MSGPKRRCYIHIGTHKTGTTSLQAFLAVNRERFAAAGVCLPSAGTDNDPGVVAHHQLSNELRGVRAFEPARGGLDAVADELARDGNAKVACLTSEDLCFLYDRPDALVRLRDAVRAAGFAPHIVVYLRPQVSYATAVYAENVRHGYRVSFADYLADVLARGCYVWEGGLGPPFDYNVLLDGFARVFGKTAISARAYQSGAPDNALLFSFGKLLVPPGTDLRAFAVPAVRHNGSLSFADVLHLLGVEHQVTEPLRFTPLDLADCLRLVKRFVRPNIRLAQRYGAFVPVAEAIDIAMALPLRSTASKTRALRHARRVRASH